MRILLFRDLSISVAAALTASALVLVGCGGKDATKTQAAAPRQPSLSRTLFRKRFRSTTNSLGKPKLTKRLVPARVEGVLQKIYFTEGTPVKKGELLMTIDKRPFEAAVQSAQAIVAKAQSDLPQARQRTDVIKAQAELADAQATKSKTEQDLRRMQPLAREKAVTEIELDAAIAAEKSAQANVDAKKAELTNLEGAVKYTIERRCRRGFCITGSAYSG